MSIQRLRATFPKTKAIGVDRDAKAIRGLVVAQEGPFKTDGRGEFDKEALQAIVSMGNAAPKGLKSRFGHPTLSEDGIGKFLGRERDFRLEKATTFDGKRVNAVRADLFFDPTAFNTPSGNLAGHVMDLVESDPDAVSTSLVLEADEEFRLNKDGTPKTDGDGNVLPPLWRPTKLHASDLVDTGDAVDGILSSELAQALSSDDADLAKLLRFDNVQRLAAKLLDGLFPRTDRDEINDRCTKWLARYLADRFGALPEEPPDFSEFDRLLTAQRYHVERLTQR